jgi:RNA polymerase sigma factor (sigma-70 family)
MLDERALLPRLQALEEEALAIVYDTLQPPLYRYALRLLGRSEVAEDLVGETFHRLLQALATGQGPRRHIQAWLYRVLHNLILDLIDERVAEIERVNAAGRPIPETVLQRLDPEMPQSLQSAAADTGTTRADPGTA